MAATIYTLSRIRVGSTVLPAMNVNIQDSVQASPQSHSGLQQADNLLVSGAEAPRVTAQVPWYQAHQVFGLTTLDISTLDIFLGQLTDGVVGSSDAVEYSLNTGAGAVGYISGMSVSQDGVAMADVEIVVLSSDGDADPLTETTGQTPPSVSQPQLYTLGGLSINGSDIDGVTSVSLSLGWSVATQRTDGDFYPTAAVCSNAAPVFSVSHVDPQAVRNLLGSEGTALVSGSGGAVFTLKDLDTATGVVGGGTARTMTISNGYTAPGGLTAAHQQIAGHSFTVHAISSDGSASGVTVA